MRVQLVAEIARSAFGQWAGYTMAALMMWTAFASVFSLLLGYSRVPYAAARERELFSRFWRRCIRSTGFRTGRWWRWGWWRRRSASSRLQQVITMLVVTRILLQFFLQQVGVMLLRVQRPELERPFRIPLYPLPPLLAMAGFVFILVNRSNALGGLAVAAGIAVERNRDLSGSGERLGQWPFAGTERS